MDKKEAIKIVRYDGIKIKDLPDHFKKDKEIIFAAWSTYGDAPKFAGENLKNKNFILELIKKNGSAIEFANDSLKNDPDILKVIKN
tara:strand:- start:314 stop:571 length:258 start_codon:yes stop_codon:yes gene_type:complete